MNMLKSFCSTFFVISVGDDYCNFTLETGKVSFKTLFIDSLKQCCGSGSGSGRIRSFLVTRIRIRENTGSGSGTFIHKKTPCYSNFLVIKLSKTQFRPNNFFIFDFMWHNNLLSLILGSYDV